MTRLIKRFIFFCIGVAMVFTISNCRSAKSLTSKGEVETSIVFEPVTGQYSSMRIPALVATKKGSLLAFCEGRISSASDWADMDLLMRRSTDGGKTWGEVVVIAPREGGNPTSNPTPIVDRDGTIHLLFQRNYAEAFYTRSTDDGRTWAKPVHITYAFDAFKPEYNWNVLAPGPGHSIQLENGRLLVPVWLAASEKTEPHRNHNPSCIATIYSDDLGKTWKRGAIVANNSPEFKNPSETMAVQLEDGRVMLSIRNATAVKRRAVSYSADGISNWSKVSFDEELFDPTCMASIIRLSSKKNGGKGRLLFSNPDSRNIEKTPRKNLTIKLSYDDGETWPVQKVLVPEAAGYSDLAVDQKGTIYCLYETNTKGAGWNYSLLLKKFSLQWLTDGRDKIKK